MKKIQLKVQIKIQIKILHLNNEDTLLNVNINNTPIIIKNKSKKEKNEEKQNALFELQNIVEELKVNENKDVSLKDKTLNSDTYIEKDINANNKNTKKEQKNLL
jgi:hypothetical protein